eukprot:Hpha_TRINITY_DN15152_c2_g2::TRINITY_DN15152_c2_g2_i1::g.127223::m.127223
MSFMIEAGTDLYGTKQNILLTFPSAPSLHEFVSNIQAQFDVKARSCRPAGYPDVPFQVETLQIFGDTGSWVDLVSDHQLRPQSQVWVFQPESIWHSDAQGVIPKAEHAAQWAPKTGSPPRSRAPGSDTGCPPTLVEKMTACFHEIDGQGKAYLLREDVERAFNRAEIQFDAYRGGLFRQADLNQSGHITWDEWQQFAIKNPSVVDALFFRLKDAPQYHAPPPLAYVSRQQGYPGSPAQYNPQPSTTYAAPVGYQPPPQPQPAYQPPPQASYQPAPQASYQPAPQASYQPPPQASYQPPAANKSIEQEVREYMNQTSPERLREGSPSRLPPQEYMNRAIAQSGQPQAPGAGGYGAQPRQQHYAAPAAAPPPGYGGSPPPAGYGGGSPHGGYGAPPPAGNSPQRNHAMQDYETARQRADQARLQKEQAEREERAAWDRLYKTP